MYMYICRASIPNYVATRTLHVVMHFLGLLYDVRLSINSTHMLYLEIKLDRATGLDFCLYCPTMILLCY